MKTSKIIFISTFGIIGLFLLSLLIQFDPHKKGISNTEFEKVSLPHFSYLIINKGASVTVSFGISDSLMFSHNKGVVTTKPVYRTSGDTLIIDIVPQQDNSDLELTCSGLKSISLADSRIDLKQISLENLQIEGENAEINFYDKVIVNSLKVSLTKEARFYCDDSSLKEIELKLNHSNAELRVDNILEINAELRDSSELSTWKVLKSDITTDETSRYFSR